jgi:hypothetical protein
VLLVLAPVAVLLDLLLWLSVEWARTSAHRHRMGGAVGSLASAFKEYGVTLAKKEFYSAAADGEIVLCLWERQFRTAPGAGLRYESHFAQWPDGPAKAEIREHLRVALAEGRAVRLVVGHVHAAAVADPYLSGPRASGATKSFDVRKDLVGRVTTLTDDLYVIDFRKSP